MTLNNNTVFAGSSTSAVQSLMLSGPSGSASVGSQNGTNGAQVGAEFTSGSLNMNQNTNTGGSAMASQAGTVTVVVGGTGSTWGNASSGTSESWTSSEVTAGLLTTGTITLNNNTVYAGSGTSALQSLSISGPSGSASLGSSDDTNTTQVGTAFTSGSLTMNQGTSTGGSAYASQSGTVAVSGGGTGRTWGNASSSLSGESSWTSSDVTAGLIFNPGTLTLNNNSVSAGGSTSALQSLSISGIGGSGSVGSMDGPFYTRTGAGFSTGNLNLNQQAGTGASAVANQTGTVFTQQATLNLGDAWTHTEAGDTSNNRQVYVETKARRTALGGSPTITVSSTAYGSLENTTAYESKQRSGGASTTYAFARNATGSLSTVTSTNANTNAWAWANLTGKDRKIT
jgi:hypothetical protein